MEITNRYDKEIAVTNKKELLIAISELKAKAKMQEDHLGDGFDDFKESLHPANLIKSAFKKVTSGETALSLGVKAAATIATAVVAKKLVNKFQDHSDDDDETASKSEKATAKEVAEENKPSMVGNFLRTLVANYAISQIPVIKDYASNAIQGLFSDKKETKSDELEYYN